MLFSRSVVYDSVTLLTAAHQASLSITISRSLLILMSVDDAIQPSQPLSSPSPPAFNLFHHQGLFQWVGSSNQMGQSTGVSALTSVFPVNMQGWFPLRWTGWSSLQSKGLLRVFSNTTVQKHRFFSAQLSLWSKSHIYTWLLEKP